MHEVQSTCCYCGTGCGVIIEADDDRISGVRGDPVHPANFGRLCTKGATLHLTARHDTRALYPELRLTRSAARTRVGWEQALEFAATRFAEIIRAHGPNAVAFYVSGQLLTEDYYVFNKLAKGLIGTNNIDTNSRLCMSSAVAGYKATLGADAPPACYGDIDHARCVLIAGSNTAVAHPVVFGRIAAARRERDVKVIVVDPRRTDTAAAADLHLAILPGTDIALYNAMLHVLLWEGLCDQAYIRAHTDGFDALKESLREYTPEAAARICGVWAEHVVQAAKWFGESGASLSFYCQGLNQSVHGTDNNAALINLHLATGQIGKPGAGPFSLTGQPNAMGGREVGGLATLLSAHRDLANPEHRAEVARMWGIDEVPETPGKTAVELFAALASGEVKAVWIVCTNPAQSMPELHRVHAALEAAELVVLQEAYADTETARFADVLLPASSWGEKSGTVTNSERRISRVRAAVRPPGEARDDWAIGVDFALRLGRALGDARAPRLFPYRDTESIFNEHRATTRGRDLDITGLSYALLDERGPQQWPLPEGAAAGGARLYTDGRFATPSGRARFVVAPHRPTAEDTSCRYPLHLITGRLRDQWHGMSRTGTIARLFNHSPEPLLAMNADDMERRKLADGDIARVKGRRGEMLVRVVASSDLRPSLAFLPMHWGARSMSGAGVNILMPADCDPVSRQPELKHAAVQVERIVLPAALVAMRRCAAGTSPGAPALAARMQPLLGAFDYATLGLAGRDDEVVVFRGYARTAVTTAVLREIDQLLDLNDPGVTIQYRDARRGVFKAARIDGDVVTAARLCGETVAQEWLREMMIEGASAQAVRRWMLAPVSTPPRGTAVRGHILCDCFDIAADDVRRDVAAGADLAAVQQKFGCGTQCGSCLPELKRLCADTPQESVAPEAAQA